MSLKDSYIKLSKKFGGTHSLINKGLTQATVNSIMRGSDIGVTKAYEVAKILGVTMEELLTGKKNYKTSYLPEHEKYIDKLIEILNNNDEEKKTAIKIILDNLKRDTWEQQERKSKQQEMNIKKQRTG